MASPRVQAWLVAVGMGITFALYGIGAWSGSVVLSSGALLGTDFEPLATLYTWATSVGIFAGCAARAVVSARTRRDCAFFPHTTLWAVLVACALIVSGLWTAHVALMLAAALSVGWSFACLSVLWMAQASRLPGRLTLVLPVSLLVAAACNLLFSRLPVSWLPWCLAASLLVSAALSLLVSASRPEADDGPQPVLAYWRDAYLPAFKRFSSVLACSIALLVIAPTVNYIGLASELSPSSQLLVITCAQALGAAAVACVLRLMPGMLCTVRLFTFMTPVFIVLLFFIPFAGDAYVVALLTLGSCTYFVGVLMCFAADAIAIARDNGLVFEGFYALGLLVVMVATALLDELMPRLLEAASSTELFIAFGIFFCIYALSMAFVYAQGHTPDLSKEQDEQPTEQPAPEQPSGVAGFSGEQLAALRAHGDLSERETEVLGLILRGKNVPAIAEDLVISQNTVRSHVKRIYRAMGVHSRQELISACEELVR